MEYDALKDILGPFATLLPLALNRQEDTAQWKRIFSIVNNFIFDL
jgi:hypothetical protein